MVTETGWSPLLAAQRATHATLRVLAHRLADLDLSASEINALANLAERDGLPVSRLGAVAGVRPTTLTSVLDRLERRGMLTRAADAGDRRSVLVRLTPAGRTVAGRIRREVAELDRTALAGLPASAVSGLRRGLDALAELAP